LSELVENLRNVLQPAIEGLGYELVDLEYKREQGSWIVRLFIDSPSGITLEDCQRVSREVSAVLDVHDIVPHAYSLEVSSPGINRPLRTAEHFRRFAGKKAKIKLRVGVAGRRNYSGRVVKVDGAQGSEQLTVEVDGKEHVLPLSDLERATLELSHAELFAAAKQSEEDGVDRDAGNREGR
jgi:ribosome maturation factor RimP